MQGGVDVGAADRLDERADDVVVLVAVAVVSDGGLVEGLLDDLDRHVFPCLRGDLQCRQRAAGVACRQLDEEFDRVVGRP